MNDITDYKCSLNMNNTIALEQCASKASDIMGCFVAYQDYVNKYELRTSIKGNNYIKYIYDLHSQVWPIFEGSGIERKIWQHDMEIFIPDKSKVNSALIYIGGGSNYDLEGNIKYTHPTEILDYQKLAIDNEIIIIHLTFLPNQYLLINNMPAKEDEIIAYTFDQIIHNYKANTYLAGHLPMVKAVIKAMDSSQEILANDGYEIENFILAGLSKRGWAAWLTAIQDERVIAIIPGVIDILNIKENINHICKLYQNDCPYAMKAYKKYDMKGDLFLPGADTLLSIEDPYAYLKEEVYKERFKNLTIYEINASGDDFFAPDSSRFYFSDLPSKKYKQILPNASPYFKGNPLAESLNNIEKLHTSINSFLYYYVNKIELPELKWSFYNNSIYITSSTKPLKVTLWTANSDNRDFRLFKAYDNNFLKAKFIYSSLKANLGLSWQDTIYHPQNIDFDCLAKKECKIDVEVKNPDFGWKAAFLECNFEKELVLTSEMLILPNIYENGEIVIY